MMRRVKRWNLSIPYLLLPVGQDNAQPSAHEDLETVFYSKNFGSH